MHAFKRSPELSVIHGQDYSQQKVNWLGDKCFLLFDRCVWSRWKHFPPTEMAERDTRRKDANERDEDCGARLVRPIRPPISGVQAVLYYGLTVVSAGESTTFVSL